MEPNIVVGIGKPLATKLLFFSKNLLIWMLGFPMAKNKNVGEPKAQSTMESIEGLVRYFINMEYGLSNL